MSDGNIARSSATFLASMLTEILLGEFDVESCSMSGLSKLTGRLSMQ